MVFAFPMANEKCQIMSNDIWKIFHFSFSISHFVIAEQEKNSCLLLLPSAVCLCLLILTFHAV